MNKDNIYSQPLSNIDQFVFDEKVVGVFDDMINRSVPGYATIMGMIGMLAERYVQAGTQCYDLGCSLGAGTLAMQQHIVHDDVQIVSVDNSDAMIKQAQQRVASDKGVKVDWVCDDIQNVAVINTSMVVLNFTLQFIAQEQRLDLMKRICDGMVEGGILVLSEKVDFVDENAQEFQTNMHHTYKKLQGYSDLEISQKRTALENVLVPDTLDEHVKRLRFVGFRDVHVWFQCFNFVSLVAMK